MFKKEYRFKFYLNARHSVNVNNLDPNIHPHTWEIVLNIIKSDEGYLNFAKIEDEIKQFLSKYEGKYLNQLPPFDRELPLMENIGEVFNNYIVKILINKGWELSRLEISENPTRTYILTNNSRGINNNAGVSDDDILKNAEFLAGEETDKTIETCQKKDETTYENEIMIPEVDASIRNIIASADRIANIALKIEDGNDVFTASEHFIVIAKKLIKEESSNNADSKSDIKKNINLYYIPELSEIVKVSVDTHTETNEVISSAQKVEFDGSSVLSEVAVTAEVDIFKKNDIEKQQAISEKSSRPNIIPFLISIFLVAVMTGLLIVWVTRKGIYPWGSDTWGHLFKGQLLYNNIQKGNFFPLFTDLWYNGVQPFRYWAPLPYYIIAGAEFISGGNIGQSYNIFLGFVFFTGAMGWIIWGYKTKRYIFAIVFGVLWFFIPDNLRVIFADGNLPRAVVGAILPYLLFSIWNYIENEKKKALVFISICMLLITLSHAMISAMVGITIFVFIILYGVINRKLPVALNVLISAVLGIALAGIWLYPALKGGLMSLDQDAVREVMKELTFKFTDSLNPLLRFSNVEVYYFGLSFLLISILGVIFGDRKSKAGFLVVILVFLGTTKEFLPLMEKIPMSQLFWMIEFTPIAMGIFIASIFKWKKVRKPVLIVLFFIIFIDCFISFKALCYDGGIPQNYKVSVDSALKVSTQRVAVLDMSRFGSFPSLYLSNSNNNKQTKQVFGWAWQGAKTAKNIVWINTAIDKGWYDFLFDRCLELGADTLVIKKGTIKDMVALLDKASAMGYKKVDETELSITLKYPINYTFGTKVKFEGFGIGKYASNISFMFPQFEIGEDIYVDDYSEAELLNYKTLFLSGFNYKNKTNAENLIKSLSEKGVKIIIDLTGAPVDIYTSRASFLKVSAQPVEFMDKYPELQLDNKKLLLSGMPEDNREWRTIYLENMDKVYGSINFQNQDMDFAGTKINDNIVFVGLNLAFFSVETKDQHAINILEKYIGIKAGKAPDRKVVPVNISYGINSIKITANEDNVVTDIANLDSFKGIKGKYNNVNNLINIKDKTVELKIFYPYFKEGLIISSIGIIGLMILLFYLSKKTTEGSIENFVETSKNNVETTTI